MASMENGEGPLQRRKRRTHSAAFKARVVLESIEGDRNLAEVAREYDLNPNQIKNWRTQMRHRLETVFVDRRAKGGRLEAVPDVTPDVTLDILPVEAAGASSCAHSAS